MELNVNKDKNNKLWIIIIATFLVLCIGIIIFLVIRLAKKDTPIVYDDKITNFVVDTSAETVEKAHEELQSRRVYYAGVNDGAIDKKASISLQNPAANQDIYLKYTITNDADENVVFETDLIESGKAVQWFPGETLEPGTYDFTFVEQPYYQAEGSDGWMPLTTGNNHVVIEITE